MALSSIQLGNDFDFAIATDLSDDINLVTLPLERRQQLAASPGIDAIVLRNGDDTGVDDSESRIFFGNAGNDRIFGNGGNDTIAAGRDNDIVTGDDGEDLLFGNLGDDEILGNDDDDTIFGGQNNDLIRGEEDDDLLSGDLDNDTLYGGGDEDTLLGGSGDDKLFGENGDDLLIGGPGVDDLRGGDGDDTLVFRSQDAVGDVFDADAVLDFDRDDDFIAVDSFDVVLDDGVDLSNLLNFDGANDSEVDTVVRLGEQGPILGVVLDITARELQERVRSIPIGGFDFV